MRAVTVCVNYDDYLALVLPSWLPLFKEIVVVTSAADAGTQWLVEESSPKVRLHVTDAFYRDGAVFNKGWALHEGMRGMDCGWIAVLDADVILPRAIRDFDFIAGNLYSPFRRRLEVGQPIPPEGEWNSLPRADREEKTGEFAGYCQIFHAGDPARRGARYPTECPTCAGCDTTFYKQWPRDKLRRPTWEVLHLGPTRKNWEGRRTARIDEIEAQ